MRIVILYTELAGYIEASLINFCNQGNEVLVVHYPVATEAPFILSSHKSMQKVLRYEKSYEQLKQIIEEFNPDKIICSGWTDKSYLKIIRSFYKKIPTILTLDNQYVGSFKQHILTLMSNFVLHNRFSHIWVPGDKQVEYAAKLGFKPKQITEGLYCGDTNLYSSIYEKRKKLPRINKNFLFIGRYINEKNILMLWEVFTELSREFPNKWNLICCGQGTLFDSRVIHPQIKHCGFVQPAQMEQTILDTGCFVLPSGFEPWGVVMHEMAISGVPLICSDAVGSKSLVKTSSNGYVIEANNKNSLKLAMKNVMRLTDLQLREFGERSHERSKLITLDKWAQTLTDISL